MTVEYIVFTWICMLCLQFSHSLIYLWESYGRWIVKNSVPTSSRKVSSSTCCQCLFRATFIGQITSQTVSKLILLRNRSGSATQNTKYKKCRFLSYLKKQLRWDSNNNQPRLHTTGSPERENVRKCSLVEKEKINLSIMYGCPPWNLQKISRSWIRPLFYSVCVSDGTYHTIILVPDYELFQNFQGRSDSPTRFTVFLFNNHF